MTTWIDPLPADPPVAPREEAEVVVVGAGIAGLSLAAMLRERGVDVLVVARHPVGEGVTGRSNAKVTALHQLVYADLAERHGAAAAATYARANADAVRWITDQAPDVVDLRPAQTIARTPEEISQITDEHRAAIDAGLPVELVEAPAFPGGMLALALAEGQGQVDPVALLASLAGSLSSAGVRFRTDVVTGVRERPSSATVRTRSGSVHARHVVLATGLPILDRGAFFALCEPSASHLVALHQDPGSVPADQPMMITAGEPKRSIRWAEHDGRPVVLVGGAGHRPGTGGSTIARYDELEGWARAHLPGVGGVVDRWSAEDYMSPDRLPYAGPELRVGGPVHVITGLSKWGFSLGVACAAALAERLTTGDVTPFGALVDPARVPDAKGLSTTVRSNLTVARHMVGGWAGVARDTLATGPETRPSLSRCGVVAEADVDGASHRVSGICPHLGGVVRYNDGDQTWDCPLHGSRFEADGAVRHGPAIEGLSTRGG